MVIALKRLSKTTLFPVIESIAAFPSELSHLTVVDKFDTVITNAMKVKLILKTAGFERLVSCQFWLI